MSATGGMRITSNSCDEARTGWVYEWNLIVLRLQSVAEIFGLSPQLGFDLVTHTSESFYLVLFAAFYFH